MEKHFINIRYWGDEGSQETSATKLSEDEKEQTEENISENKQEHFWFDGMYYY